MLIKCLFHLMFSRRLPVSSNSPPHHSTLDKKHTAHCLVGPTFLLFSLVAPSLWQDWKPINFIYLVRVNEINNNLYGKKTIRFENKKSPNVHDRFRKTGYKMSFCLEERFTILIGQTQRIANCIIRIAQIHRNVLWSQIPVTIYAVAKGQYEYSVFETKKKLTKTNV